MLKKDIELVREAQNRNRNFIAWSVILKDGLKYAKYSSNSVELISSLFFSGVLLTFRNTVSNAVNACLQLATT